MISKEEVIIYLVFGAIIYSAVMIRHFLRIYHLNRFKNYGVPSVTRLMTSYLIGIAAWPLVLIVDLVQQRNYLKEIVKVNERRKNSRGNRRNPRKGGSKGRSPGQQHRDRQSGRHKN